MKIWIIIEILLLSLCSLPAKCITLLELQNAIPHEAGLLLDSKQTDLNHNGCKQIVAITCKTTQQGHPMGGEIIVLEQVDKKLKAVWRQKNLNPWKLEIADVDGDGRQEIVVGVWKKSPLDPVMAKRPFIYSWNGKRLMPKWLGSRLSRRFDDFTLADINHDGWDELFALETAPQGRHRISAQRWNGFGFYWLGCSMEIDHLEQFGRQKLTVIRDGNIDLVQLKGDQITLISDERINDGHSH